LQSVAHIVNRQLPGLSQVFKYFSSRPQDFQENWGPS
jgi:hypothetical protein